MCNCSVARLMAVMMWRTTLLFALFSAAASSTITEERPVLDRTTTETADVGFSRSRVLTSRIDTTTTGDRLKDIWLIGLFPLQGSWPGGLGQLPAVEMGLEDVNADPRILPGYRLRMTMDDTAVSHSNQVILTIAVTITTKTIGLTEIQDQYTVVNTEFIVVSALLGVAFLLANQLMLRLSH